MVKKIKKTTPTKQKTTIIPMKEYTKVLATIKKHVQKSQIKAALAANRELLNLYWYIGETIAEQQKTDKWGTGTIEQLAEDLQNLFPGIAGFSRANIFRMHAFYGAYEKVAQAARQLEDLPIFGIPWFHNVIIIQKIKNTTERLWYVEKSIENGWNRSSLEAWIKTDLYKREGKAITNFTRTLPTPQSGLAQQTLKDPYVFDFLTLQQDYVERDVEQGLIDNVEQLLLEMGSGFALVGRQFHIAVSNKDFYLDLLFFHYSLNCFIVVELKAVEFDPRDIGQLNFYVSAVDNKLRRPGQAPTIGLILCKTKDNIIAEYALQDINKPIGVAGYEAYIAKNLPKELKSSLPSVEDLESELEKKELVRKLTKGKPMGYAKKTPKKRSKTAR